MLATFDRLARISLNTRARGGLGAAAATGAPLRASCPTDLPWSAMGGLRLDADFRPEPSDLGEPRADLDIAVQGGREDQVRVAHDEGHVRSRVDGAPAQRPEPGPRERGRRHAIDLDQVLGQL